MHYPMHVLIYCIMYTKYIYITKINSIFLKLICITYIILKLYTNINYNILHQFKWVIKFFQFIINQ